MANIENLKTILKNNRPKILYPFSGYDIKFARDILLYFEKNKPDLNKNEPLFIYNFVNVQEAIINNTNALLDHVVSFENKIGLCEMEIDKKEILKGSKGLNIIYDITLNTAAKKKNSGGKQSNIIIKFSVLIYQQDSFEFIRLLIKYKLIDKSFITIFYKYAGGFGDLLESLTLEYLKYIKEYQQKESRDKNKLGFNFITQNGYLDNVLDVCKKSNLGLKINKKNIKKLNNDSKIHLTEYYCSINKMLGKLIFNGIIT